VTIQNFVFGDVITMWSGSNLPTFCRALLSPTLLFYPKERGSRFLQNDDGLEQDSIANFVNYVKENVFKDIVHSRSTIILNKANANILTKRRCNFYEAIHITI
jgi:hypothetical protein